MQEQVQNRCRLFLLGFLAVGLLQIVCAGSVHAQNNVDPPLPDGTAAAEKQLAGFRVPAGGRVQLFAAEPQLHSPVAICLDEQGRVYVAEEYRFNRGTEENRTRPFLLEDDLQLRSTDDRLEMYRKHASKFEGGMNWFSRFTDRVVRLADTNGDGRADQQTIFADGFDEPLAGMASGLLARDGDVYLANIPHLWRLRDANEDGQADSKEKLLSGFGVNCGFLGHDLHGLIWGTDGKLYFSIGDRGFNVQTKEGHRLAEPRRGAVFRCNSDGTELEVVHRGLRNPQELALDDYGNIFADDNNCDKGDHARLVWIIPGGDSGWNMAYQTIAEPYLVGPWHAEKMWHVDGRPEQPAWVTPPIAPIGAGPSGFTHDCGWGLPDRYRNHFFMCNYTGNGGVESFAVEPSGASFKLVDQHDFLKPISATDCELGYDGRMYVSDFIGLDWSGKSKGGRIYAVEFPELLKDGRASEVSQIMRKGFKHRSDEELLKLLGHFDQRVRLRAQFSLAERGDKVLAALQQLSASQIEVADRLPRLARLHAIWALGQVGAKTPLALEALVPLLEDEDVEVRAQVAKTLGERKHTSSGGQLLPLLSDESARVKFFAAIALGQLKHMPASSALWELVKSNPSDDRYLRHAAVFALSRIEQNVVLRQKLVDNDPGIRLATVLIYRLRTDPAEVGWLDRPAGEPLNYFPEITQLLNDPEPQVASEAARMVNDFHLDQITTALADRAEAITSSEMPRPDPFVRRVINANFRVGETKHALNLLRIAGHKAVSLPCRQDAIAALAGWGEASSRDRVTGFWRPLPAHDVTLIRAELDGEIAALLAAAPAELQADIAKLIQKLELNADEETFLAWLGDERRPAATRVAALSLLAASKKARAAEAVEMALVANEPALRIAARDVLVKADPQRVLALIQPLLLDHEVPLTERQRAFFTLASMKDPAADEILKEWVTRLAKRSLQEPEIELDVLEAAASRDNRQIQRALAEFENARSRDNRWWRYEATISGGDASRGRALFVGHAQAQCIRCHKVAGQGGDVGPDLSRLGAKTDRRQFRQSLLEPDAMISLGFGVVTLALEDGRVLSGTLKNETNEQLEILTPDGQRHLIPQSSVERRTDPKSPMPPMEKVLSPRDVRDLVEFLAEQK